MLASPYERYPDRQSHRLLLCSAFPCRPAHRFSGFCLSLDIVTYFALLLWAAFAGSGLGGPLAYPARAAVFTRRRCRSQPRLVLLFFPPLLLHEWFAGGTVFPVLTQIPLSVGFFLPCFALLRVSLHSSLSFGALLLVAFAFRFEPLLVGGADCAARFVPAPVRPLHHSPHWPNHALQRTAAGVGAFSVFHA